MPELDVRASGAHAYDVIVTSDDGGSTEYRMTVPESFVRDLGEGEAEEPMVARRALELLLELRGGAMPREFSLAQAETTYPGFNEQLRVALGRR